MTAMASPTLPVLTSAANPRVRAEIKAGTFEVPQDFNEPQ